MTLRPSDVPSRAGIQAAIDDAVAAISASSAQTIGYATGYGSPGFGSTPSLLTFGGLVFLSGTVAHTPSANLAAGDVPLAALPVGARPMAAKYFVCQGAGASVINLQVNTDGSILVKAAPTGATSWLSLDGIVFRGS